MLFPSSSSGPRRVVVTGAGITTALGPDWQSNLKGFQSGRPAFKPVTLFDVSRQKVKQAAQISSPPASSTCPFSSKRRKRLDRAAHFLLTAGSAAFAQAGWEPAENLPMILGTTSGGMTLGEDFYRQAVDNGSHRHQASRVRHYQPQQQALDLLDALGSGGPVTIIANACASGANAIGHAWHCIRDGLAERVLTGGYDGLSQLVFSGFDSLQALSPTQCKPFDLHRDGLGLGEGAAVLALESLDHAQRRDAQVLAEIVGYGAVTDPHHLTQPQPQGEAARRAMEAACRSAAVEPAQIGYLNAHGTGTPLNDEAEAHAINRWAGAAAETLRVSSTKSMIGHLLGAAGAVETVVCLMALREQWLPPNSSVETIDPICRFQIIRESAPARLEYALTNSFGFGGANASLLLRRWT